MEVFMNRNFAKISVAIVALMLVLAFCMTGCKVNDVAADLDNTKNEVSANKTDAAKALEAAVKALEAKIAANEADCAAEIAALNAAIEAVKEAGEATDADLAAAEATLAAAIDAVRESLNKTKAELSDKITANDTKINAEVAALNAAIANAEAALKAAGEADKAALETAIAEAKAELEAALAALKADVEKLTAYVDEAVAALQADIAAGDKELTSAIVELKNALALASVEAADADAALKAELEQAISEAVKAVIDVVEIADAALQAQVEVNAADIAAANAALEAAKIALEDAHATDKAELEGKITNLETTLSAEIEEVKNTLQAQIDANADDIKTATEALEAAKVALGTEHATDKKELEDKISSLEKAIYDKIDEVKAELEDKIESLGGILGELGDNTTIIGKIAEINAAIDALGATDAAVAETILAIEADIDALYAVIAEYRETTEEVVKAWHEILATYNNWVKVSVAYGVTDADMLAVEEAYASAQVRLYRALNSDDVVAIKDAFFTVIESVKSGELEALYEIYNNLVAAENGLGAGEELEVIREALDAARVGLDARTEAKLIVDGKVVDLYDKYAAACAVYTEQRIAALTAEYEAIVNNINEAKEYGDVEAIDKLIAEFKAAVDAADAETDAGIPVADEVIATLNDYHVDLLMRTADKYLEISAVLVDNATVETIDEVAATVKTALDKMEQDRLPAMAALGIDVYGLGTKVVATRVSVVSKYIELAGAGVAAAEKLEDLADDWAIIETVNVEIEALVALSIDATAVAEARDALVSAYFAKYVDIYAANLTAEMNAYIDNLGAIFAEVTEGTTNIADIRADYFAFVDNRDYAEALRSNSEAVAALVAAEAAFVKVEEQYATLTVLVDEAEDIAAILDNEVFEKFEGTNVEYTVIRDYRTAATAWVEALDELYADFTTETNAETYTAIRALIDEAKFDEIKTAFEAAVQTLVNIAKELIEKIDEIKTDVETNGQRFDAIVHIEEAWEAFRAWEQNATDADGVGFIISYVSEEKYTNENLNTVLVNIQTAYEAYVEVARIEWADRYVGTHQQALVEGTATLTYKDDLSAVREWFEEFGIVDAEFVAKHGLGNIGTAEVEAKLAEREAELEVLKAEREALVADLKAQGAAIQAEIDALDLITTDSAAQLKAIRDAYVAWVAACVENEVVLADLDLTKLAAAEATLENLYQQVADIKALIEALVIPTLGTDPAAPYFADVAAKDAYVAEVEAIKAALAVFEAANDGYRNCFEDDELAKVEAANPDLYVSKYEAALNVYNTYLEACATVQDAAILAKMAEYLEQARAEIDAVGQVATFAVANDYSAVLDALCAFYEAKFGVVVVVYNAYVAAVDGVANETVLTNVAKFLDEAVNEISDVEAGVEGYEEAFKLTRELYTLKMDTTVDVYDEYVAALEGVEDETILTKMNIYFNEAIREVAKANTTTTNYISYIQQIGTNAAGKFEDIKNNKDIDIEIPVCEHVYDNACDVDCNKCSEVREVPAHVYDNACDANCNECGVVREVPAHVYDNACDADCNVCGAEREVPAHVYDNACDANCNVCDAVREVPAHVYDNACDTNCNVCDAEREVPAHVYDNACDVDCNACGETRVAPHVFDNACDAECNDCDEIREVPDHVYDNACDEFCNECGAVREVGDHVDADFDGVCDECDFVQGTSAEWPLDLELGWTTTPEFVAGTSLADPGIQTYYYKGVATVGGVFSVDTMDAAIVIFVNGYVQLDADYNPATKVTVAAGDVIELNVENAAWTLDAVTFNATLAVPGTQNNPFVPALGTNTTPEFVAGTSIADPGISTYYYSFTAEDGGTFTVSTEDAAVVFFINGNIQLDEEYNPLATVAVAAGDVVEIHVENANWTLDAVSFDLTFVCSHHNYEIAENGAPVCVWCGDLFADTYAAGETLRDLAVDTVNENVGVYNEEGGYVTISGATTRADDLGVDKVYAISQAVSRYLVMRYRTSDASVTMRFVTWCEPAATGFIPMGTGGEWETVIIDLLSNSTEVLEIRCNIFASENVTTDIAQLASFATLEDAQAYVALYNESIACEEHPGYRISANGKVKCTECGLTVLAPVTYTAGSDIYYRATAFQVNISGITYTKTPCVDNDGYVTITGVGSPAAALDDNNFFSVAQGGAYEGGTPVIQRYLVMRVRTNAEFNLMYIITHNGAAQQPWSDAIDLAAASKGEWATIVVDLYGDASVGSRIDISLNLGSAAGTETDISHIVSFSTLEEAQVYANVMGNSIDGVCPHAGITTTITTPSTCAKEGEALLECAACGHQATQSIDKSATHTNIVTGAEHGLADGQVKCLDCGQVCTPVTYQAGGDLFDAVVAGDAVDAGDAGITITGVGTGKVFAANDTARVQIKSSTGYGQYLVVAYNSNYTDAGGASYLAIGNNDNSGSNNYAGGIVPSAGYRAYLFPNTTGATGEGAEELNLLFHFGGSAASVTNILGVVTFNTLEEAQLYTDYLNVAFGAV